MKAVDALKLVTKRLHCLLGRSPAIREAVRQEWRPSLEQGITIGHNSATSKLAFWCRTREIHLISSLYWLPIRMTLLVLSSTTTEHSACSSLTTQHPRI